MRSLSHSCRVLALLAGLLGVAPAVADGRWQSRVDGGRIEADWRSPDGATRLRARCDRGDPVIVLRIRSAALPAGLQTLTLAADAVRMGYPLQRTEADDGPGYVARIALDAPILDRILLARAFSLAGGGHTVQAGVPGDALARVVVACRAIHWPRDARRANGRAGVGVADAGAQPRVARIASSDAGLAKK